MLTKKEIDLVKDSWSDICANGMKNISQLFYNYLANTLPLPHPVWQCAGITEQSCNILAVIDSITLQVEQPACISVLVNRYALPGVPANTQEEHYTMVGRALLWTVQHQSGNRWHKELKQAWILYYTQLAETLAKLANMPGMHSGGTTAR